MGLLDDIINAAKGEGDKKDTQKAQDNSDKKTNGKFNYSKEFEDFTKDEKNTCK